MTTLPLAFAFITGFGVCAGLSVLADHVEVSQAQDTAATLITAATDDLLRCNISVQQCHYWLSHDPRTWRRAREVQ
jgi:hypothetical protein